MQQQPEIPEPGSAGDKAHADNIFGRISPALIDPQLPPPAGIVGPRGNAAVKRFNVYRNNVTVSLVNALSETFPAVQRIVGEEFFRAMAKIYVRRSPPKSRLLFEYGETFADFIEDFEAAGAMPWLADVARIERAWLDVYHSADAPVLLPEHLAAMPPDMLATARFCRHPACRVLRSSFPAADIFAMNREDGKAAPIESRDPQDVLITRPEFDVTVRTLPPGGAEFLQSLFAGGTLSEAADAAIDQAATFDLPANIAGMLEAGVFASAQPNETH